MREICGLLGGGLFLYSASRNESYLGAACRDCPKPT